MQHSASGRFESGYTRLATAGRQPLVPATTEAGGYFGEVKIEFQIEHADVRIDPIGIAHAVIEEDASFLERYNEILEVIAEVEDELPNEQD